MIVRIEGLGHQGLAEYGLLEFQGEVQGELRGEVLKGKLSSSSSSSSLLSLEVGDHSLVGSIVQLSAPFLLTEKTSTGMRVLGVVRQKYVFDRRPEYILHR